MDHGTDRINKIVLGLRNFAKKDDGLPTDDVDLNNLIRNDLRITQKEIKKVARVQLKLDKNLPMFKGNRQKIEQVLMNLLLNAAQAIDHENGLITIETSCKPAERVVVLKLTDNGVGMDEQSRKHIFDPFFTTKRDKGGTGLGLSITYGIIKDHNGQIEVDSEPGTGTSFYHQPPHGQTGESMTRILVIDDDRAILNFMKIFLLQTGKFEVEVLNDSSRAYQVLTQNEYDILLLDMDMPEVSGMDILRFLKQEEINIFTVVLTGVEDIDLAITAMKLGISDYLLKPVEEEKLLEVLASGSRLQEFSRPESGVKEDFTLAGLKHSEAFSGIITQDNQMLHIFHHVEKFAETDNSILIWGESGAGKELIAHAIHDISSRGDKNFIAVNAGAFADDLFTSEFFGHEKGSFTGAVRDKKGFIEEANGGHPVPG